MATEEGRNLELTADEAESVEVVAEFQREHEHRATPLQHAIDSMTNALGRPATLIVTVVILLGWAVVAHVRTGGAVDEPIFAWLELAATLTALLVSIIILITQRREDELADRRAQLTLELALLADKKAAKIISLLQDLRRDHPELTDPDDAESEAMSTPADARAVVKALDAKAGV